MSLTLEKTRETYYDASGTLSNVARQLCFAGIAFIWIFSDSTKPDLAIPTMLIYSGLSIILSLIFDILQYVLRTIFWGMYSDCKEQEFLASGISEEKLNEKIFLAPRAFNLITNTCLALKIIFVSLAYIIMGIFLFSKIWPLT